MIGRSGNTGNTNNFPHLHVCDPVVSGSGACVTQPITFRNTPRNPNGLQRDRRYEALP
jgi:murein DD-endopeptidase MepM/ murein hydrolase activator NlpD